MHPTLEDPRFWPCHYYLQLSDDEHDAEELIEPVFGLAPDDVNAFYHSTVVQPDEEASPLDLEVVAGYSLGVELADCGEDGYEQRYYITHESWESWELFGYDSPHFALPAFRWEEVSAIGAAAAREHGEAGEAAAVLLLLPSIYLTDADDLAAVTKRVAACWRALPFLDVRQPDRAASTVIAYLSGHDIRWWHDPQLGWINDGDYSFRNPHRQEFDEERFARMKSFLAAVGVGNGR